MTSAVAAAPPGQWDFVGYFRDHSADVLDLLGRHVWLSALPVVLGLLIALPLGSSARRYRWLYPPLVSVAGLLYTIPSLALFVLVPGLLGTRILDPINVVVPLTIYTVALLVRVVADALAAVPDGGAAGRHRDGLPAGGPAAPGRAADRRAGDRAGLRVAAVSNVSLVSVAALIGTAQLGQLFTNGFQLSAFSYARSCWASCCRCCWRWSSTR